jgi:predicted NAD-dependent protein-ADP-ribosyltransferase YbiA (DUF1768 family)
MVKPMNVWSMSDEPLGRALSNFAHTPFLLDGLEFASVEAFYVWLLLTGTTATEHKKDKVRRLYGPHAKRLAPREKPEFVVYREERIRLGSPEHHELVKRALRAKLSAHPDIARDLVETGDRPLIHETGYPDRPGAEFPREVFCGLLTELRYEFREQMRPTIIDE